jgi:hypothetical protein
MADRLHVWLAGGAEFDLDENAGSVKADKLLELISEGQPVGGWLPARDGSLVRADAIIAMRLRAQGRAAGFN